MAVFLAIQPKGLIRIRFHTIQTQTATIYFNFTLDRANTDLGNNKLFSSGTTWEQKYCWFILTRL